MQSTDPLLMGKMEREDLEDVKQVVVGICAMAKKSNSKPMKEILARLDEFDYIKTVIFPEETILKVIDALPLMDLLILMLSNPYRSLLISGLFVIALFHFIQKGSHWRRL